MGKKVEFKTLYHDAISNIPQTWSIYRTPFRISYIKQETRFHRIFQFNDFNLNELFTLEKRHT